MLHISGGDVKIRSHFHTSFIRCSAHHILRAILGFVGEELLEDFPECVARVPVSLWGSGG